MKRNHSTGIALAGRFLLIVHLLMAGERLNSQEIAYEPDKLFRGFQCSFDFKMVSHFNSPYTHDAGFYHDVRTKGSFAYEMGIMGHYYFNKNWSVGLGAVAASKRYVNHDVIITEPGVYEAYSYDPELYEQMSAIGMEEYWIRNPLSINWSMPVYGAFHQYIKRQPRHKLDYRLGLTIRYYSSFDYIWEGIGLLYEGMVYDSFEEMIIHWQLPGKPQFDIQPYIGYTYVLKNHRAISAGLMGNLAFAKHRADNEMIILEGTPYEETGHLSISNHYLALQFSFVFTTPEKSKLKRQERREERKSF